MVTVAIVAILASIAYPSYQQYVIRSNRSEMQQFMLDVANREEEYLLNNRTYTNSLGNLALTVPARLLAFYATPTITVSLTPPSYAISAVPKNGTLQAKDPAGTLGLNSQGMKTPADKW